MLVDVVVKVKYRVEVPNEAAAIDNVAGLEARARQITRDECQSRQVVALDAVEVRP